MRALSQLFDSTRLVVPCSRESGPEGISPLTGHNLAVIPVTLPFGRGLSRKARLPFWLLRNLRVLYKEIRQADAVHAPIPGDVGTIGMMLAFLLRKRLFVRHCGNWLFQQTFAERFWRWFMEQYAGGRNVMLATGGAREPPSRRNGNVRWIFSTSLTTDQIAACARVALPRNPARLVIAGRQEEEKGTGVVIRSLRLLAGEMPEISLDVIGDGPARQGFERLARDIGVAKNVRFHGNVAHDSVIELMRCGGIFCFPTTSSEGFPKVVVEALACGLPVVTTPVSVLPDLLRSGCGVLIQAEPAAVADAVRKLASCPDQYAAMSIQAIETAKQYSLERWRDEIGSLLESAWGPLRAND